MRFAAIGLDHRHIYDLVAGFQDAGAICAGHDPDTSDPRVLAGFRERFPEAPSRSRGALLDDPSLDFVCCAAVPADRADLAIEAMRRGKDVVVDKPGVTTPGQLAAVEAVVAETGRIFSICFSERFLKPATQVAARLIAAGRIGRVVHTVGLGPHRLNRAIRPAWFFEPDRFGGILTDIGSHQIDQFLHFTGTVEARIVSASVRSFADVSPGFQDWGEIVLANSQASGYVRVDWFTPDGLPTWGDGRLFITGTEGSIELRKYVDVEGRPGTDHIFLVDRGGTTYIDASAEPLVYFDAVLADIRDRTETAMAQSHVFAVSRLALEAQAMADRQGAAA